MTFFTVFVVLPTEEICTLRRISSGVTANDIKSRLEVSAGLPSQIYHLSSRLNHILTDDYVLQLHHNVWNGFLYRTELKDCWRSLFEAVVREDVDWLLRKGRVCMTSSHVCNANDDKEASLDVEERGCVALYLASWIGSSKMCQTLLSIGVNPNGATRNHRTPLFAAVASDNFQVVGILLNHGAKLSIKDCNGDMPLDIARRNSAKQCVKRILSAQNITIYNLKTEGKSSNTEIDTSFPLVTDKASLQNTASVESPDKRPFTSHDRTTRGCMYTLKAKPATSLSRRSVTFSEEYKHSLRSRNDKTLLPDVNLRMSDAHVHFPKGVSLNTQRPNNPKIPELLEGITLRVAKSPPRSAPGKSWSKIKDAVTKNGSTTASEILYTRSVLGKERLNNQCGDTHIDLNTAVSTEQSGVAKSIDFGVPAADLIPVENEQSCVIATGLTTVENEQRGFDATDLPTAETEQSGVVTTDLTTTEIEQSGVIAADLTTTEIEQSGVIAADLTTAEIEQSAVIATDLTTAETEQSCLVQSIDLGTSALNLTTAATDQSDVAKIIELDNPAPNLTGEVTNPVPVPSSETNGHVANVSERHVESASNLRKDGETNTGSPDSWTDARPLTADVSVFTSKKFKSKSADVLKTAVRQIKLAEHQKRVMSASEKNKRMNEQCWKTLSKS